jgi:5-methylcytosine-specific restriction endonuclease McrA
MVETRSCRPGGHNPPATDEFFYRNQKTGRLRSHCKECRRSDSSRWYGLNTERARIGQRRYSAGHREENRTRCKDHYSENKNDYLARNRVRQALEKGVRVEYVDRTVVYERDQGICGICRELADVDDFHVDHIIPLAKGGEHSYENVQVAHPSCNRAKRDRVGFALDITAGGDQHF